MFSVNEESTAYLTVEPLDKDGVAATPTTMEYRIDCATTGREMVDTTTLTPGTSVEITIPPTANVINNQLNSIEYREVTVTCGYGADDQVNEKFTYVTTNLRFVPKPSEIFTGTGDLISTDAEVSGTGVAYSVITGSGALGNLLPTTAIISGTGTVT